MKKNQLIAYRKRMQKACDSFARQLVRNYLDSSHSFCDDILNKYNSYCRKMLFCTIGACLFNVIFVVVIILATL